MLYLPWKIQVRIFFQGLVKSWSNDSNSNLMREIERRCYLYAHSNSNSWMEMFSPREEGGGYFYIGRLRSKIQPLTLSYTIFGRKGTPFTYPVYDFPSLLKCSKGNVFKIWITHKNRTFSRLFHSHEMHLLVYIALLGLYRPKWQISSPFHILQQVKIHTLLYTWSLKKVLLSGGAFRYKQWEYRPRVFDPPPPHLQENYTNTLNQSCNLQSSMLIRSDTKTYHNLQKNTPWPPCDRVNDLYTMAQALGKASKT